MLLVEVVFLLISLFIAVGRANLGSTGFLRFSGLGWLARNRGLAVLSVGLSAIALRLLLLPILPIPQPNVHDEFSYLLMADTFSHRYMGLDRNAELINYFKDRDIWFIEADNVPPKLIRYSAAAQEQLATGRTGGR